MEQEKEKDCLFFKFKNFCAQNNMSVEEMLIQIITKALLNQLKPAQKEKKPYGDLRRRKADLSVPELELEVLKMIKESSPIPKGKLSRKTQYIKYSTREDILENLLNSKKIFKRVLKEADKPTTFYHINDN